MHKKAIVFLLTFCLSVSISLAKEFLYPSAENPVFSVTFSDNWKVDYEGQVLQSSPPDCSIYLGIWALEKVQNFETALKAVDGAIAKLVSDVQWKEPEEILINEITFLTIAGIGKAEGEQVVSLKVAVFSPDGEKEYILLYFGVPDAEQKYEQDLTDIIESISGVNEDEEEE
jgi:hypothetical protein